MPQNIMSDPKGELTGIPSAFRGDGGLLRREQMRTKMANETERRERCRKEGEGRGE